MAISPGTRFGSYEVVEAIGAGGMGEVYRARDTQLKRDVAVKVLPESFAADADRVARFRREAEILASLNHANIAQVHGLEKMDGQTVIVMELVEGPTLADRIEEGPLPPDEAMSIAFQIVSALEAAHANQIVHRDLKPANVKLKEDGTVKVLDFGISKSLDPKAVSGPAIMTTPAVTQTGVILGTAAYMSPEQARGKFVDARTDIWAFGCLLFEMLTGQPAFGGEDVMVTLARVLDRDTDLSSMPKTISPAVRHTLKLCLEKDPRSRIADIRDVRLALEGRFEAELRAATGAVPVPIWRRALPAAAAMIVGGIVVGVAAFTLRPPVEPRIAARFDHQLAEGQSFRNTGRDILAISPDGRRLVYNTSAGLYVREMGDPEARLVPGTEDALTNPFLSPDGEWIGYWDTVDLALKKISITGGAPVVLTKAGNPQGATWTADDWVVFGQAGGIMRVSANGGTPELLLEASGQNYWDPQVLPDGSVLYTALVGNRASIVIESPGSGERQELFEGERAIYLPTGHLVTTSAASPGTLFVRSFDLATRSFGGAVPIEDDVFYTNGKHHFAVSAFGTLAMARGPVVRAADAVLAIVDRNGNAQRLDVPPAQYRGPRVSPDATQVAVEIIDQNQRSSIWIYDLTGARAPRALLGAGNNARPLWTPDGARLTFASDRDGSWGLFWELADGSGTVEKLATADEGVQYWPDSWSPDTKTLVFTRIDGDINSIQEQSIWTMTLDDEGHAQEPEVFVPTQAGGASFSSNGQWIAYRSTNPSVGATNQIHVQPFPPTGAVYAVTDQGGSYPIWTRTGNQMLYRRPTTGGAIPLLFGIIDVSTGGSFAWGNETEVAVPGGVVSFGYRDYDFLPNGDELVVTVGSQPSQPEVGQTRRIQVVTNWFELVEERAPAP